MILQLGTHKLEKVEITLADCLACSGCITSAEGVLITQQSQEELLKVLNENNDHKQNGRIDEIKTVVFTLSQQSCISLAQKYQLDVEDCARRLTGKENNLLNMYRLYGNRGKMGKRELYSRHKIRIIRSRSLHVLDYTQRIESRMVEERNFVSLLIFS